VAVEHYSMSWSSCSGNFFTARAMW
jgi:hypothetical protein